MKKNSSFAIADEYLKSSIPPPPASPLSCEQIADIDSGTVKAVLIESEILCGPLWFSFLAEFDPGDGVPVFYPDELCLLKDRPVSTLRKIYETKKAAGSGTRVRH